ncbi:MAG: VCBS repeat-containing protein [Anaerolineae bacterium]|nr:VCBS repeat-containing protein [Anaerolineae bacterium]
MNKLKRAVISGVALVLLGGVWTASCVGGHEQSGVNDMAASAASSTASTLSIPFHYSEIDDTAGDIKLVGDIDLDGFPDLVIGGMPSEPLTWYEYPDWTPHPIATANTEFTTDGELGDVDGDGDLDIVVPDGSSGSNLLWFQNPLPGGNPRVGTAWVRHIIGVGGSWVKDVELADFDGNGRLDVAYRINNKAAVFFQTGANTWSETSFSGVSLGSEGMASGDIDANGAVDLVLRGVWLQNPKGNAARTAVNWIQHTIGTAPANFKALVTDLNQDKKMDVLFSSSEDTADVDWWTPSGSNPTGAWTKHTILAAVNRAHTLQAADMDIDGDIDVVVAQMHTSSAQEIMIVTNVDGEALSWHKEVIAGGGLHNGVVADVGNDGDYDIYGANWTGNPPVRLWENQLGSTYLPLILNSRMIDTFPESAGKNAVETFAGAGGFE